MITKEIQSQIKVLSEDKDKTFQVGHRMQRNQNWQKDDKRKRKYFGSEVMAMDVLERVCSSVVCARSRTCARCTAARGTGSRSRRWAR